MFSEIFLLQPPKTFRNGWTSERAYNVCTHNISEALQKDMYKAYVDVPYEKFIEACVKDIEVFHFFFLIKHWIHNKHAMFLQALNNIAMTNCH